MNDRLALSDEILMSVEKPARYIGHEVNAVYKDLNNTDIRFAFCFPDVYEIGMSHLGIQILYDMLNQFEDTWCERVYSPWPDLDKIMRDKNIPLFALESQDPIKQFDFLGITLQYEMCYTNVLQILDLSQIPLYSKDRDESFPIVIGGGPCSYNPEPIADFFDIFYMGEGETRYRELLDLYKNMKRSGFNRKEFLHKAALIPGMYIPSLYEIEYNGDNTIKKMVPLFEDVPSVIVKELVKNLDETYYPVKPVVGYIQTFSDRVTAEIQRGCIRGCRFCQAGQIYRPVRERSVGFIVDKVKQSLLNTGFEEINLSSLSSSDYSNLESLLEELIKFCNEKKVNISLPSLRIDNFSLDLMSKVQDVKKSSLTFAPEAGSQRLRNIINKNLTEEEILNGCKEAFLGGWNKVKLYFMLGQPMEEISDIEAIGELAEKISEIYYEVVPKEKRQGKIQITVSTSYFVPKPFTPFQWSPQDAPETYIEKVYTTKRSIMNQKNQKVIKYNWHDMDTSVIEAVLARGDRRLSKVLTDVYKNGGIFDAWSEYFHKEIWENAFESNNIDKNFYLTRERSVDEVLPWDFIDVGVSKEFLKREWEKAKKGETTPNCKEKCNGCGAGVFAAGICVNKR